MIRKARDIEPDTDIPFHRSGLDCKEGFWILDTLGVGKGREGFLEECAWEMALEG